ncbi:PH domain-containing protein [Janibacter terrae]|uniref:PH domain-containing protein n=1 Tax=Janibacter terrae TaxID=103817 RepID=UPI001478A84F|nr:PH domain-containing protein [Janibacter terrae]
MPAVTVPDRASAAPFRPVRGRWVSAVIAVVILLGSVVLAATLPERFGVMDRLTCAGIGGAVAAFLSRFATLHARPRAEGLLIRNLGPGEVVPWEDMLAIRFSQGMPWPRIDLADGTDVAVMAIQRSDGERSVEEAQRLADLIGR